MAQRQSFAQGSWKQAIGCNLKLSQSYLAKPYPGNGLTKRALSSKQQCKPRGEKLRRPNDK